MNHTIKALNVILMKSISVFILIFFICTTSFTCKNDDTKLIEREEVVEDVIAPDTIAFGETATIKINYILSICWNAYDRTETVQQDFDVQFKIISKGEERPDVGCPGSIIHQSIDYIFSPTKSGSYKLIFNNGLLIKDLIVI